MSADAAIAVRGLGFRYTDAGSAAALDGVDLDVPAGGFVALVGRNGSGKTTLAKHLNGLLRPGRGTVTLGGVDVATREVGQLARTVGYVFQNPDHQIFNATVGDEVAWGPRNLGLDEAQVRARVADALERFDLAAVSARPPAVLGLGVRRKVAVASVFAMHTPVLVLDEPTAGLDAKSVAALMGQLADRHRRGGTVLLITHDMDTVARHAPRTVVMDAGRVLADGATGAVFRDAATLARSGLEAPRITRLGERLAGAGLPGPVLSVEAFCDAYGELLRARR